MHFPTRQELIKANKWDVKEIETKELGRVRLAAPSAAGMFRFREIQAKHSAGELSDTSRTAEMIAGGLVDEEGAPVFKDANGAHAFFEVVSTGTLGKLMVAYVDLVRGEEEEAEEVKAEEAKGAPVARPAAESPPAAEGGGPPAGAGPSAG